MATLVMLAGILFFLQRNWRSLRGRVWKSIVSLRCDWIGLDSGGRELLFEEVMREETGNVGFRLGIGRVARDIYRERLMGLIRNM